MPTVTADHVARCEHLRTIIQSFNDVDRATVVNSWPTGTPIGALRNPETVTVETLRTIEQLVESVDPFRPATVRPVTVGPEVTAPAPLPVAGEHDEGPPVDPDIVQQLRQRSNQLTDTQRQWMATIVADTARAGASIHMADHQTARRYHACNTVVTMAADGDCDTGMLRSVLATILGPVAHDETRTPGRLIAALNHTETAQLDTTTSLVLGGQVPVRVNDLGQYVLETNTQTHIETNTK